MTQVVIAQHEPLLTRLGLATLEQVKAFRGGSALDQHGRRREIVRIEAKDDGLKRVLFLKRNWRAYKKDGLASLLQHGTVWSIARQEWENSWALESAGLKTATLVAYDEECGWLWERFSFIITEAAPGRTVEQFLRDCCDRALRWRVFDALAKLVRKMHNAGLATPDLFTRHVFVETTGPEPQFRLIDMSRVDRCAHVSDRLRARDLAALNVTAPLRFVSARERLRFLRIYSGRKDKRLARLVEQRTAHLLRRRKFRDFSAEAES